MTRVLLVLPSSTYRATEFLAAATRLGVDVVTGSDAPQAMAGALPDRFLVLPLDDPTAAADAVESFHSVTPLDAVVAVDDVGALAAAAAAERLGLARNPAAAIAATRDKAVMRRLLGGPGSPNRASRSSRPPRRARRGRRGRRPARAIPVVVKPCSLAASRGVIRADDRRAPGRRAATVRRIAVGAGRPATNRSSSNRSSPATRSRSRGS